MVKFVHLIILGIFVTFIKSQSSGYDCPKYSVSCTRFSGDDISANYCTNGSIVTKKKLPDVYKVVMMCEKLVDISNLNCLITQK
jgi:hypothetical protein